MEKIITRKIIDPCGADKQGNLRRWIGFEKGTDTFYGGEIVVRLDPPESRTPKTPTKNSKT